jgi:hypothetical protein
MKAVTGYESGCCRSSPPSISGLVTRFARMDAGSPVESRQEIDRED